MILFFKGFLIGLGKIIPGVSGGMLAISLGIYEKSIRAISDFFQDIKNNFKFLLILGIGITSSIVLGSNIIKYFLNNHYLPTMLLFIGIIIGGIPSLYFKIKNNFSYKQFFLVFIPIILLFTFSLNDVYVNIDTNNKINVFLLGILDSITMIIPGISGTAILMLLNCYDEIIEAISIVNLNIVIPFFFGIVIGSIAVIKMVAYFLKNHEISSYFVIFGLAVLSILLLLFQLFQDSYSLFEVLNGVLFMILGIIIGFKFDSV